MKSAHRALFASFAFATTLAVPAILTPVPAAAQEKAADPGQFVKQLGDKAIAQLATQQVPEEEERARFKNLLNQYFDDIAIGKFTVGRAYWGTATPAQQKEFL